MNRNPWFAFLWGGELLFYLSCEAGAYPLAVTRAAVPFYSMMYAIGVVRRHTSLTDLITPDAGMAAGFRKMATRVHATMASLLQGDRFRSVFQTVEP